MDLATPFSGKLRDLRNQDESRLNFAIWDAGSAPSFNQTI